MARFYYLLCAFEQASAAQTCAVHFHGRLIPLTSGETLPCKQTIWQSDNQALTWVSVEPLGVSLGTQVPPLLTHTAQLDEVAAFLYRELAHIARFRCAIAGWEVADLFLPGPECGSAEMRIEPAALEGPGWAGLVISIALLDSLTEPQRYQPFGPGCVWQPYTSLSISGR